MRTVRWRETAARGLLAAVVLSVSACTLQDTTPGPSSEAASKVSTEFLGLRTAKYSAPDLAAAKAWYSDAFGVQPYFDEPFYVGFNINGFELGITPDSSAAPQRAEAGLAYWGVANAERTVERLVGLGAVVVEPVEDVGGGVRTATLRDPFGNLLGVIENPDFRYVAPRSEGPGR
jgi:predicted enzyme related to lactoylglutathione lyase